ncbi:MFS transporter [Clostridium sp. C2-6-12]|uniref:MFS transporter n=1 Tax=Clostridium sp. C2-6-12 TaxID=2698832 RepID=UPI00136982C7|nr:MFS transporter [Clostridium sp. C2-6-12]
MQNVIVNQEAETSQGKLSFMTKLSYGLGEFACSVVWSLVSSYLLFFYTDVFGLAGAVIAILLLVARVWDCFVDPMLGLIMERTKSRFGRFRPYILFGSISLGLFNILTFYTPQFSGTGKAVYACVTYLLLGTFHSVVNVPYGALATVMTRDTNERTNLNAFRGVFGQVAGIVTGATVMPLITILGKGNNQNGYFYAAIVLSVISMPMLFLTFKNCKEVIEPMKEERPSVKESLLAVVKNKQLLLVLSCLAISLFAVFGRIGVVMYYAIYVLGRPDLIAVMFTTLSIAGVCGAFVLPFIAKFFEKKTVLGLGNVLSGISFIALFFTPASNITVIIGLTFVGCLSIGFSSMMFSMVGDCIDDYQVKSGLRSDGAIYSFTSLTTKIVNAIVGSLSVAVLGLIGYVANAQQTPETIKGLNMLVNLVPGVIYLVALIPLFFYTLSKAKATENTNILIERQKASN